MGTAFLVVASFVIGMFVELIRNSDLLLKYQDLVKRRGVLEQKIEQLEFTVQLRRAQLEAIREVVKSDPTEPLRPHSVAWSPTYEDVIALRRAYTKIWQARNRHLFS